MKLKSSVLICAAFCLAACDPIAPLAPPPVEDAPSDTPIQLFDAEAAAEEAAVAVPTGPQTSVAGLGDVAAPGLWAATSLVVAPQSGTVTYLATGASVTVQLRPLAGEGGTQLSLATFQALGAPITELIEVRIAVQ
ncbi:hypothetical protein [Actibacterium mucosum]|nr:hypothetical protein [Actibacterium mucosum]